MVIWFSRRWTILLYVVKCLPRAKGCSDRASQHYWPLQWVQKMFVCEDYPVNMTKVLIGIQDLERAVFSCQCKPFAQGHFWCHHCIPWPWKCGFWYTICHTFDILDQLIIRYCVVGGHLGKWRCVQIQHTSDDVITQFRDPLYSTQRLILVLQTNVVIRLPPTRKQESLANATVSARQQCV